MKCLPALLLAVTPIAQAAITSLTCQTTAVPPVVRSEGLAERFGDIQLICTGTPLDTVSASLQLFLSVNVTNRISPAGFADAVLTYDTGSGPTSAGVVVRVVSLNSIVFESINFTLGASGSAVLRLTNLRGAPRGEERPIQAFLATNGASRVLASNTGPTIGIARRGLLAASTATSVVCQGSTLPAAVSFSRLLTAGTRFATVRATEALVEGFQKKDAMTDSGVRVILRYSGFPTGTRIFVPDAIAGSSAVEPTAAGDLGFTPSGGKYAPGPGSMLLSLVKGHETDGSGGVLAYTPGPPLSGTVNFDDMSEIQLINGAGQAVFEVMDSNATILESAQIPTFFGIPPVTDGVPVVARVRVSYGPLSTVAEASMTAPIPRFLDLAPLLDCTALRDCDASYFPRLTTDSPNFFFTTVAGGPFQVDYLRINNTGGGLLNWSASVTYKTGLGWLRLFPDAGLNHATLRIDATSGTLAPGVYEATLLVDAGPLAGSKSFPVFMEVKPAPAVQPPPVQPPAITSVENAATFAVSPLVPGSLTTLRGRFSTRVTVTLDGLVAQVLHTALDQVNLLVPPELAGRSTALLVVFVDGVPSVPVSVPVALSAPGVFRNGILNQDSSINGEANAALVDSILQVFATGLPLASRGRITARIHDRDILQPLYGGPAPGLDGVQQINFPIPGDLPAMTTELLVCGAPLDAPERRVCSPPALIVLRR